MIALALCIAFQDTSRLTLRDVAARALAEYPSVAAARAARDRAGAEASEAAAARLPRLTLDASATRYQEPMLVYPLHGLTLAPGGPLPTFDRTLLQGSALASWTVFDFGQRSARVRAARLAADAADATLGAAEQQVVARAAAGYLRLLTQRGVLAAQDERLRALESETQHTRQLLEAGKAARIAVLRIEAELERARAERIATAAGLEVAERDLAQVAQLPFEQVHGTALVGLTLGDTVLVSRDSALALARAASPMLREARRRAAAAAAAAGALRATRFPELRLSGGYVDRGYPGGDFAAEWQAGLGVSWPLWTGGQRGSQIRRGAADARAAAEQYRLAELSAAGEIDRARAALSEARGRVQALERAVATSVEVVRIERLSLEVGQGTQTDYLDAEANLLRSRASLVEARHAAITARIELARITGELSLDWLAATLTEPGP